MDCCNAGETLCHQNQSLHLLLMAAAGFSRSSMHHVMVAQGQVVPVVLHLLERKEYTKGMFEELVKGLGSYLGPKMIFGPQWPLKIFPSALVDKHHSTDTALLFSTAGMKYSFFFQPTTQGHSLLLPFDVRHRFSTHCL